MPMEVVLCGQVACLGVPDAQWAALGHAALQALQLEVASKAFGRIKETSYLRLLHQLEQARKAGQPAAILKADVLAYQVHICMYYTPVAVLESVLLRCNSAVCAMLKCNCSHAQSCSNERYAFNVCSKCVR